jgi:hypothetical protein
MRKPLAILLLLAALLPAADRSQAASLVAGSWPTNAFALTDGGTITVPCPGTAGVSGFYTLTILGNNHVISLPQCTVPADFKFAITQGAGGPYTGLSFSSAGIITWPGGTAYTPTSAGGALDYVSGTISNLTGSNEWDITGVAPNLLTVSDPWQLAGSAGCNSGVVLSNGNLTASVPSGGFFGCLATHSHTTGQYYFFETATSTSSGSNWIPGFANASTVLNNYFGSDLNSIGVKSGTIFYNNSITATGPAITTGTVVRFDVDLTNKQLGINVAGTEYPSGCVITTPTGCFSFSTWNGGAAFPAFSGTGGTTADTSTINATSGTGPGGSFVPWQ